MQTDNENTRILADIIEGVTPQLFAAYGTPIQHWHATEVPTERPLPELAGVLGFVGQQLHGTITLAASRAVMVELIDRVPGAQSTADWLAELTNQLLGRVKSRLLRYGATVLSSTPVVVEGTELEVRMGDHSVNTCHLFKVEFHASNGVVQVWLGAEIAEGIVLTERSNGEAGPSEGEHLLF